MSHTLKLIVGGITAVVVTVSICYLLTALVLTSAGYPMW